MNKKKTANGHIKKTEGKQKKQINQRTFGKAIMNTATSNAENNSE